MCSSVCVFSVSVVSLLVSVESFMIIFSLCFFSGLPSSGLLTEESHFAEIVVCFKSIIVLFPLYF